MEIYPNRIFNGILETLIFIDFLIKSTKHLFISNKMYIVHPLFLEFISSTKIASLDRLLAVA
jgi:hypothetical protein